MREIKFRGKTKDGRWVQGVPIKNGFGKLTFMCFATSDLLSCPMEQIYKFCIEVIPETVTQYAELKDKNGVEIFEGDIYHHGDSRITYTVVWHDTGLMGKQNSSNSYAGLGYWSDRIEVIGNQFENPELIGKNRIGGQKK